MACKKAMGGIENKEALQPDMYICIVFSKQDIENFHLQAL
jgi:hypothetical protein